jgi:hypothetical protein
MPRFVECPNLLGLNLLGTMMDGGLGNHVIAQASWKPCAEPQDVKAAAERRYGEHAEEWLAMPQARLGGLRPRDLLETEEGCVQVMRLLDMAHRW